MSDNEEQMFEEILRAATEAHGITAQSPTFPGPEFRAASGFWNESIFRQFTPIQQQINQVQEQIRQNQEMMGISRIMVERSHMERLFPMTENPRLLREIFGCRLLADERAHVLDFTIRPQTIPWQDRSSVGTSAVLWGDAPMTQETFRRVSVPATVWRCRREDSNETILSVVRALIADVRERAGYPISPEIILHPSLLRTLNQAVVENQKGFTIQGVRITPDPNVRIGMMYLNNGDSFSVPREFSVLEATIQQIIRRERDYRGHQLSDIFLSFADYACLEEWMSRKTPGMQAAEATVPPKFRRNHRARKKFEDQMDVALQALSEEMTG